jgi:hypothetical protein
MRYIIYELGDNRRGKGRTFLMGVKEITHTRVPYNTLKVTNALGKICVKREGLHHLPSCAIRSLAAHLAKLVPCTNVKRSKERLQEYECFNLATSNRKSECRIHSLAPKTVPRLSMLAATRPSFLAICLFRQK